MLDFTRSKTTGKHIPDCICHTYNREIHHLGIMSHRAMHRRKLENCTITFSSGKKFTYKFDATKDTPHADK